VGLLEMVELELHHQFQAHKFNTLVVVVVVHLLLLAV
jgi:hypothetical protein